MSEEAPKEELRKRRLDGWKGLAAAAYGARTETPKEDEGSLASGPAEREQDRSSEQEGAEGSPVLPAPGPALAGAELARVLALGQEEEEVRALAAPGPATEEVVEGSRGLTASARSARKEEGTGESSLQGVTFWKAASKEGRTQLSLLGMARESLENATSWSTAQGALARRLKAGGLKTSREEPTPREREAARKLQLLASSGSAREALEKGKLES